MKFDLIKAEDFPMESHVAGAMARMSMIETLDDLVKAAQLGHKIRCKQVSYLETWKPALALMDFSVRGAQNAVNKGLEVKA